jgi:hypothetical protein
MSDPRYAQLTVLLVSLSVLAWLVWKLRLFS